MMDKSFQESRKHVQTTNQITGERRWWALAAVMISMFFSSLDQTVVSTALPTIISDLGGLNLYAWVFTAYILATSVTIPIYGRLSDTYGRKPFYIFGLLVFLTGSALCGLSHSMKLLITARAIQGVGGGALMSIPRATIGDIFNPRERGRWMGIIMSTFALASLIGPALGGWFTDHVSWRWVFYINLPVALIALGMIIYTLPTVRTGKQHRLDWSGSVLLAAGLIPMLLGFTWGGTKYAWGSWQELGLFIFAATALTFFVFNERRASEPVIEMSFFANRTFSLTMIIGFLVMISMFAGMLFLPLFVQGVMGISAEHAGYILTPMMVTFILGSVISGQVMTRTGKYKLQASLGGAFLVVGTWLLTRLRADISWTTVVFDMIILGFGIGSLMPVVTTIIQNLFPHRILGTVNATQQSVQTMAGAIAAPIYGTVMANRFAERFPQLLPAQVKQAFAALPSAQQKLLTNPQGLASAAAQAALKKQFVDLGIASEQIYRQFIDALHQALTFAITNLYVLALVFTAIAFLATFALKEIPLKQEEFYTEETGEQKSAHDEGNG
jgi:EmrB/QacA subfamily drug resistance transporter